jgi:primosomal protein N' (replication factor Y)
MLHSSLKLSERYDQWKRIRRGEVDVVLGTRSAVFSPLKNLGLSFWMRSRRAAISPKIRPVTTPAMWRNSAVRRTMPLLLLGSATPSVESAWAARQGIYQYNLLRKRYNEKALPQVTIADLRQEVRSGNRRLLRTNRCRRNWKKIWPGEQSILFLNRRGNSRMLLCGECGYVPTVSRCSVPHDVSLRQRAADVPLLRPFGAGL